MDKARTITWESVADWFVKNEQALLDAAKFEGFRGAVVEVLRLAPEQPALAALREELAKKDGRNFTQIVKDNALLQQRLTAAEQRNATMSGALLKIIEMNRQYAEDRYGDANKAESWPCIVVARAVLKLTKSGASE